MTVAQAMQLYFSTFEWPFDFKVTFEFVWFIFSIQIDIFPVIPVWVTLVVQFAVAFGAIAGVVGMAAVDDVVFREEVIEAVKEEGLLGSSGGGMPEPGEVDLPTGAPLDYKIDGENVVGFMSRMQVQASAVAALHGKPKNEGVVWVTGGKKAKQGGCCAVIKDEIPAYVENFWEVAIRDFGIKVPSRVLKLLGFPRIDETNLIELYAQSTGCIGRTVTNDKGEEEPAVRLDSPMEVYMLLTFVARYYHIAVDIDAAAKLTASRVCRRYKAVKKRAAAKHAKNRLKEEGNDKKDEIMAELKAKEELLDNYPEKVIFDGGAKLKDIQKYKDSGLTVDGAASMIGISVEHCSFRGEPHDRNLAHAIMDVVPEFEFDEISRSVILMMLGADGAKMRFDDDDAAHIAMLSHLMEDEDTGEFAYDLFVSNFALNAENNGRAYKACKGAHCMSGHVEKGADDKLFFKTAQGESLECEPIDAFSKCPFHDVPLINALITVHVIMKEHDKSVYPCQNKHNEIFRKYCMDDDQREAGCDKVGFVVCQDDTCGFSLCATCYRGSGIGAALGATAYGLRRKGLMGIFGLIMILIAQAMYMPAVGGAITIVFCHVSLSCQFPTCYSPATPGFMLMAVASLMVLIFMGIGMVSYLFGVVYRRKKLIISSGCMPEEVLFLGNEVYQPGQHSLHMFNVLRMDCDPMSAWETLIERDNTMFRPLYEQYEFRNMCIHPVTFLFKAALLIVVLYAGEPNSLDIIVASAIVEIVQLLMYSITAPFLNPWIDLLGKSGPLHQVVQLGLICVYRADTFNDPKSTRAVIFMILFTAIYFTIVIIVISVVVIAPLCASEETEDQEAKKDSGEPFDDESKK